MPRRARAVRAFRRALALGCLAAGPGDDDDRRAAALGKVVRTWPSVARAGSLCEARASSPGLSTCSRRAGSASATSNPAETRQERSGRRSTRSTTAGQKRESGCRLQVRQERNPALVDPRAEQFEHRGQDGDRAGDGARDDRDRAARDAVEMSRPSTNMPAIAITTVVPEMRTVRPDVRAVRSRALRGECRDDVPRGSGST